MKCIPYNFTYNKLKFVNTLVMELVFTERQFNREVDKILKQVKLSRAINNSIEEHNYMEIDTDNLYIEAHFDKDTIIDAARYMIAKLLLDLGIKLKYNLDLIEYLEYDNSEQINAY